MDVGSLRDALNRVLSETIKVLAQHPEKSTLPTAESLKISNDCLIRSLDKGNGIGLDAMTTHLLRDITPGFSGSSLSSTYYGFVTGGTTPAARVADHIVTLYDQNVQVHLPGETTATTVEYYALKLLLELLYLDPAEWLNGTTTTGATSSNVLGLACGREYVLTEAARRTGVTDEVSSVAEVGMFEAFRGAGVEHLNIVTTMPHSSIRKAAGVLGLGRRNVIDVGRDDDSLKFDFAKLEAALARPKSVSIVVISCGEVNTGGFATSGMDEFQRIRKLCDQYAFGLFARALPSSNGDFRKIVDVTSGLELADSFTIDGHKLLNVPYDCGFFFTRHARLAQQVFQNPNAAYLQTATVQGRVDSVQSPLNIGLENSRRFRALPVYASLVAYGRQGYMDMLIRQVTFAREVARYVHQHERLELLPANQYAKMKDPAEEIFIIVLFRAKDSALNQELVKKINASRKMYVSGTIWDAKPATRVAVSNWQVEVERDFENFKSVMEGILRG
ncbi:hypothetical protein MMC25_002672 [Agyrium rufum]|nr:hypothetical protein [Agyrium rufum]